MIENVSDVFIAMYYYKETSAIKHGSWYSELASSEANCKENKEILKWL